MALKDLKVQTVEITVGAGSFAVRGLSASDIDFLVRKQGPALRDLFNKYISGNGAKTKLTDLKPVFAELLVSAPGVVLDVIATAADADAEETKVLASLPAGTQIQALLAVVNLTLGADNMGKLVDLALKATSLANGGLSAMLAEATGQQISEAGSVASGDK